MSPGALHVSSPSTLPVQEGQLCSGRAGETGSAAPECPAAAALLGPRAKTQTPAHPTTLVGTAMPPRHRAGQSCSGKPRALPDLHRHLFPKSCLGALLEQ